MDPDYSRHRENIPPTAEYVKWLRAKYEKETATPGLNRQEHNAYTDRLQAQYEKRTITSLEEHNSHKAEEKKTETVKEELVDKHEKQKKEDIATVAHQANVSVIKALDALKKNNNNVVDAILYLTM